MGFLTVNLTETYEFGDDMFNTGNNERWIVFEGLHNNRIDQNLRSIFVDPHSSALELDGLQTLNYQSQALNKIQKDSNYDWDEPYEMSMIAQRSTNDEDESYLSEFLNNINIFPKKYDNYDNRK